MSMSIEKKAKRLKRLVSWNWCTNKTGDFKIIVHYFNSTSWNVGEKLQKYVFATRI